MCIDGIKVMKVDKISRESVKSKRQVLGQACRGWWSKDVEGAAESIGEMKRMCVMEAKQSEHFQKEEWEIKQGRSEKLSLNLTT